MNQTVLKTLPERQGWSLHHLTEIFFCDGVLQERLVVRLASFEVAGEQRRQAVLHDAFNPADLDRLRELFSMFLDVSLSLPQDCVALQALWGNRNSKFDLESLAVVASVLNSSWMLWITACGALGRL